MPHSVQCLDSEQAGCVEVMRQLLHREGAEIVTYPLCFRASLWQIGELALPHPPFTYHLFLLELDTAPLMAPDRLPEPPQSDPWLVALYFFPHGGDDQQAHVEATAFARQVHASHRRCYGAYGDVWTDFMVLPLNHYPPEEQLLAAARAASDMHGLRWLYAE